jgi:hypothetical protein
LLSIVLQRRKYDDYNDYHEQERRKQYRRNLIRSTFGSGLNFVVDISNRAPQILGPFQHIGIMLGGLLARSSSAYNGWASHCRGTKFGLALIHLH